MPLVVGGLTLYQFLLHVVPHLAFAFLPSRA